MNQGCGVGGIFDSFAFHQQFIGHITVDVYGSCLENSFHASRHVCTYVLANREYHGSVSHLSGFCI